MKFVRFDEGRLGAVIDDHVVDLTALSPVPIDVWPPVASVAFIEVFDRLRPRIDEVIDSGPRVPIADVRLLPPVIWPNKLLGMPANYSAHIAEMRSTNRANLNGFFLKASSSLSGPADPIVLPAIAEREVHHECELGVIVGRRGRGIAAANSLDHVFGYTCLIDMTVRGSEERVMRKSFDTFCPIGPWIVTADELPDPTNVGLKLWVNDELRQHANTQDMIVPVAESIELISAVVTLEPGDVIASGTPEGVGPLHEGDVVTIEIDGVGRMAVNVIAGTIGSNVAFDEGNARR